MRTIRIADVAVFAFAIIIIGVFSYYAYTQPTENTAVYIKTESGEYTYPLDQDRDLHLDGPIGETHIIIQNGEVLVETSPCREKICIASSPIFRPGTWLACLPNRIFIRIEGSDEEQIDASSF